MNTRLYQYLAYAGIIPFAFGLYEIVRDLNYFSNLGSPAFLITSYGVLIAVFLSGSHWGTHLALNNRTGTLLALVSNINMLCVWGAWLTLSAKDLIWVIILSLLITLVLDLKLAQEDVITQAYYKTRFIVTMLVCAIIYTAKCYL